MAYYYFFFIITGMASTAMQLNLVYISVHRNPIVHARVARLSPRETFYMLFHALQTSCMHTKT